MIRRYSRWISLCALALCLRPAAAEAAEAKPSSETSTKAVAATSTAALEIYSARGETKTATMAAIRTEVPIDPDKRSVCMMPKADGRPGVVSLSLEGLHWDDWPKFCEQLVKYLRADKLPFTDELARGSERLLAATGFFAAVHCTASGGQDALECAMAPELMVRDVKIEGSVPFSMLKEDITRQIYLRSGKVLPDEEKALAEQTKRIESYFYRNGYFDSQVKLTTEELEKGAEPNQGVRLHVNANSGKTVTIRSVHVEGEADLSNDEIGDIFYHYIVFAVPRRFRPEVMQTDIDDMTRALKKKGYPEAQIAGDFKLDLPHDAVDVNLTVRQGPKVILHFVGNTKIDDDDLRDRATFTAAGSADAVEIENTRKRIIESYQREGNFAVQVRAVVAQQAGIDKAAAKRIRDITFVIWEGPSAEVQTLAFEGNQTFRAKRLLEDAPIKSQTSGFLFTGRWIDDVVEHDRKALLHFYHLQGFARVGVAADRNIIATGKIEIRFTIEEGPRRVVSTVSMAGNPAEVPEKDVREKLKLKNGAPYLDSDLAVDRRTILTMLAGAGYPRASVWRKTKMPYKTEAGSVELSYKIEPGPRSIFGGTLMRGNFRTGDSVITNELSLSPGEPLNLIALGEAKQNLRKLGVFGSVQLEPLDTWKSSNQTWLLVDVQERDQRDVDVVFGFRTDELFNIGADFRDNDFFGRAIRLDLSTRLSNASGVVSNFSIGRADRVTAKLTAPHPLGLPFSISYSGSYLYEDKPRYKLKELSALTTLFRTLLERTACDACPTVVGSFFYKLSSTSLTLPLVDDLSQLDQTAQNEEIRMNDVLQIPNQTIARIGPRLTLDRLDSSIDPRAGYSGDVTLEFAHPLLAGPIQATTPFWRLLVASDAFLTLGTPWKRDLSEATSVGGPVVAAVGVKLGVAQRLNSGDKVPVTETFAYGGDLNVRGIEEKASTVAFLGANYLITGSAELRWYFLQTAVGAFQVAALTDTGMVSLDLADIFNAPTVSVGAALRFVTPVGPVSFAYAIPVVKPAAIVKLDPSAIPPQGRLHFTFGYTF